MFTAINYDELQMVNGGFQGEEVVGGAVLVAIGVGCLAGACVPGLNVAACAGLAYLGSWGLAGGATMGIYGLVA